MSTITYIVDDQDTSIEYQCPVNQQKHLPDTYYGRGWTTIEGAQCGGAWFTYKFNGTSVRVSNRIKPNNYSTAAVQIDISPLVKLDLPGNGTYQSPTLQDGEHSITYALGNQSLYPAFDYLTVTAGPSTQLKGRTIIVDDSDSAIQYSGNWKNEPTSSLTFDYASSPYLETVHWTNTVGDSASYSFEGTSVAVYGVIPPSPSNDNSNTNQNISISYTLDSTSPQSRSFGYSTKGRPLPMLNLFQVNSLSEGRHTIVFNVTDIPPPGFGIDFIVYNASFDNLASIHGTTSHPTSAASTPTLAWQPIVGGVVGGIALLLGLIAIWVLLYNKKKRAKADRTSKILQLPTGKQFGGAEVDETKSVPLV